MNRLNRPVLMATVAAVLSLADFAPDAPRPVLVRDAAAIIGMPFTPFSFAGVARRTTARVMYADTAAMAATAAAATTAAVAASAYAPPAQIVYAPPPPPPAPAGPPIGSTAATLPAGCVSSVHGGVEYFQCGAAWYRAGFQGNSLIYLVVPRP